MSATMESELVSKYFDEAPVYVVKGRTFPVEVSALSSRMVADIHMRRELITR